MSRIKARPRQRGTCYAYLYEAADMGNIIRMFQRHVGGKVTAEIKEDDTLIIYTRDSVMGETDTWTIRAGSMVVYNDQNILVMAEKVFNEYYERVETT